MPTNHDVTSALPSGSTAPNKTLLRDLLVKRMAYVVEDADEAADLVAVDPDTGTVILVIICLGRNFLYDPLDTTTAHDGTTCLVSSDGKRYKLATGLDVVVYSVLERGNTPPESPGPDVGDAYLVTASPTGDWVGHADDVAVYTARGWEFITPGVGRLVYVEDEDSYYHKDSAGDWQVGFGAQALSAGIVLASNMNGGAGELFHQVENQTTNIAPVVTNGVKYIIGPSPTGIWAGNAGKLAIGENGSWTIYTPTEGWRVYDKSTNTEYSFDGSSWIAASGDLQCKLTPFTASGTFTKQARCVFVEVHVQAEGGNNGGSVTGDPASFGSHCSANGGTIGTGGTASGGDVNISGETGSSSYSALGGGIFNTKGKGVAAGGGGGGYSSKIIPNASLGATETVTIGAKASAANNGFVLVREFYRA